MPWNMSGSGPWGAPPNKPGPDGSGDRGGGDRGGGDRGNGDRRPNWGGGAKGPPPWSGVNRPQAMPDLDELLAGAQAFVRRRMPGGGGPGGGLGGGLGGGFGSWFRGGSMAIMAALLVAVWLGSGFYRVEPDEQGVVMRFGAFIRSSGPGLNYHLPWPIESVMLPAVTRINRTEIGYRSGGPDLRAASARDLPTRDIPEESLMLTGDENIIDTGFAVLWRISDAPAFLFNTRHPESTVKAVAESVMREVIGRTPIQPALTDARAQIETSVMRGTQAILDQYGTGVEVTQVQLQKVDPPAAVIDSFRDVQRANTEAERMVNQAESYRNDIVPRARGDAARITTAADGARTAAIAEATGQASRFESVLAAYRQASDVTLRRIYIETMEQILQHTPTTVVDDRIRGLVPYLPLGDSPKPSTPPSSTTPPLVPPQVTSQARTAP